MATSKSVYLYSIPDFQYRVIVPYTWVISPVNRYNCMCCMVVSAIFNYCEKFKHCFSL